MQAQVYESYPAGIVLLANALSAAIYAVGAYILAGFGPWAVGGYLVYCLWAESRVLRMSCVNCYYYGKWCGLGRGKVCAWLFDRGDPARFASRTISWWDIVPDFFVSLLPFVAGIILLIEGWSWVLLALLVALVALTFGGNAFVRGSCLCNHCKQRELGCPAEKLFGGNRA